MHRDTVTHIVVSKKVPLPRMLLSLITARSLTFECAFSSGVCSLTLHAPAPTPLQDHNCCVTELCDYRLERWAAQVLEQIPCRHRSGEQDSCV